jgi:biotin transport system substrate-specific component
MNVSHAQAMIPTGSITENLVRYCCAWLIGAMVIALCAQISVPIPGTPVPMTLQLFAVTAVPIVFGVRIGLGSVLLYVLAGVGGMPVFANVSAANALWGPTSGYIVGFVLQAWVVGLLSQKLRLRFPSRLFLALLGSAIVLVCGASVLGLFVGWSNVWNQGIQPFLLKDVVTSIAVALVGGLRGSR